ncbi:MAG: hypothetical protein ACI89L_000539 [Phycisphaerales bacterium]|jgi:hypothetical protein
MTPARPIILLGTHRSGTTWLGSVLSAHPGLAYYEEPRHVWCWGNASTPDDRLTEAHATPRVRAHIHAAFDEYLRKHGGETLCEKTPSNCLRVPFLNAVYPEAKLLFVVRDGRSVIRSTAQIMAGGVPTSGIVRRAFKTPPWEWPAYSGRLVSTLKQKLTGGSLDFWGPRPPGWRDWLKQDHPDIVLAKQWAATVTTAYDDLLALGKPGEAFFMFRYEDMAREPGPTMGRLAEFLGIPKRETLLAEAIATANPSTIDAWRDEIDDEDLERIRPVMEPALERLGYTW